jgi:L-2-hydroxyglutarate oxidase LhgO
MRSHVIVAGAGILGLATAAELIRRGHTVTVLEKELGIAQHQTGNNSGVIHSGLYYKPGSLKAKLGTAGATSMRRFAEENGVRSRSAASSSWRLSCRKCRPSGAPPTRPGKWRAMSDDQF